ncbi:hypothetical protein VTN77DRAFT_9420 [Rasamsonia byssochlamydoides]|uniref:uncharacterized protein n=1 Tax=Rasamsonia byssochlamydoides TaxID=89139 RepID=UPI0037441DB9
MSLRSIRTTQWPDDRIRGPHGEEKLGPQSDNSQAPSRRRGQGSRRMLVTEIHVAQARPPAAPNSNEKALKKLKRRGA